MNQVTILFANGGYVLQVDTDDSVRTDVFVSTGKLNRAVRDAIAELSLLPKKDAAEDAE